MSVESWIFLWVLSFISNTFYFGDFLYKKRWVRRWPQYAQDIIAMLFALTGLLLPVYLLVDVSIKKVRRISRIRQYERV